MDDLQFDKADYAGTGDAATVCAACQNALTGEYFHINGRSFCASCKSGIEQALGGTPGATGFAKAVAGGVAGGIAGALLYYLVRALTGYEIGIIAIAVGFLVGRGVRWGTGGRGGPLYQAVAIGLTYVAIVSTYVPEVIQGMREAGTNPPAASAPVERTAGPGATPAATTTTTAIPDDKPPITFIGAVIGLVVFFVLILALPFLAGFSNIIGIVIIAIGLYEAWKINKRLPLEIAGPFAVPAPGLTAPAAIPVPPGS